MKHFICRGCGNLVATVEFTGRPLSCCAGELVEIVPDSVDASREKHAPVLSFEEGTVRVTVGKEGNFHPMSSEHSVEMTSWAGMLVAPGPTMSSITELFHMPNLLHNIYMGFTQSHLCW